MSTSDKWEAHKVYLKELTFAHVNNTIAKDEDLISFTYRGVTVWRDEPFFDQHRKQINRHDWVKVDRSYTFYYGFAESTQGRDIHFSSKRHSHQNKNFCGLGVNTNQQVCNPPKRGSIIVGQVRRHEKGSHFFTWSRCTESEKLFVDLVLNEKSGLSSDELMRLSVNRHVSEGGYTNQLIIMAILLLNRDLDYFLRQRMKHGGSAGFDGQVYQICVEMGFGPDLWEEYKYRALEQNIPPALKYSKFIPEPEPKPRPITEQRALYQDKEVVGLSTPFKDLKI